MNNLDLDGLLEPHAAVCVFPVRHHLGALGCPTVPPPPPGQYSLDWAECRSAIWAGLTGQADPTALPTAVLSGGGLGSQEGRAQGRGGCIRPPPSLGDESRGTRPPRNRQGISALLCPSKGPRPLLFPRVTLGQMLLNL